MRICKYDEVEDNVQILARFWTIIREMAIDWVYPDNIYEMGTN